MARSTTHFRHKYWDGKLSQIPSSSLTCVHAIALGQRRMLGKIFVPENSSPAFSPRPPSVACEHPRERGARHRHLGSLLYSGAAAAPIDSPPAASEPESRVLGASLLRFLSGTARALLLYRGTGRTREQWGTQTSSVTSDGEKLVFSFALPVERDHAYGGGFRYKAAFAHCKSHTLQSNSYQLGGPEQ